MSKVIFLSISLTICLLFLPKNAFANFGLELNPSILKIKLAPGQSTTEQITITNKSNEDTEVALSLEEFTSSNQWDGTIQLTPKKTSQNDPSSALVYFKLMQSGEEIDNLSLPAGEDVTIDIHINVPEGSIEKDTYATLLLTSGEIPNNEVQIETVTGSNILLSVSSNNTSELKLAEFNTDRFHITGQVPFTLLVENPGKFFQDASTKVEITNMLGIKSGTLIPPQKTVLSGSKRYITGENNTPLTWTEIFPFGFYTATATVENDNGTTTSLTTSFITLPLIPIFALILFLSFIVGIYLRVRKKI